MGGAEILLTRSATVRFVSLSNRRASSHSDNRGRLNNEAIATDQRR
jgi:hypothetical protein